MIYYKNVGIDSIKSIFILNEHQSCAHQLIKSMNYSFKNQWNNKIKYVLTINQ